MNGFLFDENLPANIRFTSTLPVNHVSVLGESPSDTQIAFLARVWSKIERLIVDHKLIDVYQDRIEAIK